MAATATAAKKSSCGTYDRSSGFPICSGECLRQHMGGPLLPSFAERFETIFSPESMAATAAKRSICSSASCGIYDRSSCFPIRSVCGECLRQHMGGPLLPSFAERYAGETRRCSSPLLSFSSSSTVTAEKEEEEVDGSSRLVAFGDGRLRDCYMAPHLRNDHP